MLEVERMLHSEGKQGNWRELCAAATAEADSEKLASLVHQILQAFDEQENRLTSTAMPISLTT
jgi:hypothetical protein